MQSHLNENKYKERRSLSVRCNTINIALDYTPKNPPPKTQTITGTPLVSLRPLGLSIFTIRQSCDIVVLLNGTIVAPEPSYIVTMLVFNVKYGRGDSSYDFSKSGRKVCVYALDA